MKSEISNELQCELTLKPERNLKGIMQKELVLLNIRSFFHTNLFFTVLPRIMQERMNTLARSGTELSLTVERI